MAEAAVDKQTNVQPLKYFCHQCSDSVEINASADATNLTCPKCESSFIEELTQELENDHLQSDEAYDRDSMSLLGTSNPTRLLSRMFFSLGSMNPDEDDDDDDNESDDDGLYHFMEEQMPVSSPSQSGSGSASASGRSSQQSPFHRFLEQLLGNLRAGSTSSSQAGEFLPGFSPFLQGFHGDPRDYAWGADGIDNIITELLNQTEGTGPPPATKEDIETLTTTTITQDYIDKAVQCSVCLESFVLEETVKSLPCEHIFHSDCVIPWLQLHRTCPICRKAVGGVADEDAKGVPESCTSLPTETLEYTVDHAPSQASSSSSKSSMFEDAIEEAGQEEPDPRVENNIDADFDGMESVSDMEI